MLKILNYVGFRVSSHRLHIVLSAISHLILVLEQGTIICSIYAIRISLYIAGLL